MLETVMDFVHNYFERRKIRGKFTIAQGTLVCNFLQEGQYFKVIGSVFNDGVHQYPSDSLHDETFVGEVWAMAVPPTFIALCDEIEAWVAKYGEAVESPYTSESFGGYSYTKASGSGANGAILPGTTWQSVFGSKLIHWRKII